MSHKEDQQWVYWHPTLALYWLQVRRDSKKYRDHATPAHCRYAASLGNAHAKELMEKYIALSVTRRLRK